MDENNKNTRYGKLNVPGQIKIGEYLYTYKDQFKSDKNMFTYRCHKSNCMIPININLENIDKIKDENNKEPINYIIKKEHKCNSNEIHQEDASRCNTETILLKKANEIIRNNPLKPLSFHQSRLKDNEIILPDKKVNRLIYKIRNEIYPNDEMFIKNIESITITFDNNLIECKDLPFCPLEAKFLNIKKIDMNII